MVLKSGIKPTTYAQSLVMIAKELLQNQNTKTIQIESITAAADGGNPSDLLQRIRRILGEHNRPAALPIFSPLLIPIFMIIVASTIFITRMQTIGQQKKSENSASQLDLELRSIDTFPSFNGIVQDSNGNTVKGATVLIQDYSFKLSQGRRIRNDESSYRIPRTIAHQHSKNAGLFYFKKVPTPKIAAYANGSYPFTVVALDPQKGIAWKSLIQKPTQPLKLNFLPMTRVSLKSPSPSRKLNGTSKIIGFIQAKNWNSKASFQRDLLSGFWFDIVTHSTKGIEQFTTLQTGQVSYFIPKGYIAAVETNFQGFAPKLHYIFGGSKKELEKQKLKLNKGIEVLATSDQLLLDETKLISAQVVNRKTGLPVGGTTVSSYFKPYMQDKYKKIHSSITDSDGWVSIQSLGRDRSRTYFKVTPEAHTNLLSIQMTDIENKKIQLNQGVLVEGHLKGDDGTPIGGKTIVFNLSDPSRPQNHNTKTTTNTDGKFKILVPKGSGTFLIQNLYSGLVLQDPVQKWDITKKVSYDSANYVEPISIVLSKNRVPNKSFLVQVIGKNGKPAANVPVMYTCKNIYSSFSSFTAGIGQYARTNQKGELYFNIAHLMTSGSIANFAVYDFHTKTGGTQSYKFLKTHGTHEDGAKALMKLIKNHEGTGPLASVSIQLKDMVEIQGIVKDFELGTPVKGAHVFFDQEVITKDFGTTQTATLPFLSKITDQTGTYRVLVIDGIKTNISIQLSPSSINGGHKTLNLKKQHDSTIHLEHRLTVDGPITVAVPNLNGLSQQQKLERLKSCFKKDHDRYLKVLLKRTGNSDTRSFAKKKLYPNLVYLKAAEKLVNESKGTQTELETLLWAMGISLPYDVYRSSPTINEYTRLKRAFGKRLLDQYVVSKQLEKNLEETISSQANPILTVERIASKSPHEKVKARAVEILVSKFSNTIRSQFNKHKVHRWDDPLEWRVNFSDRDLRNLEIKYLKILIDRYAKVPHWNTKNYGIYARRRLNEIENLSVGKVAPEISGPNLDGDQMKLSDFRGKYVVLDFWGSWCGPCIQSLPKLNRIAEKFKDDVVVLGVMNDKKASAKKAVAEHNVKWKNWFEESDEGPIQSKWGINGWPTTYLIGPDGKIVSKDLQVKDVYRILRDRLKKEEAAK